MASAARKLIPTGEAIELAGYGPGSFRKRVAMGLIPVAKRDGRRLLFDRSAIMTSRKRRQAWVDSLSTEMQRAYLKACEEARQAKRD
jgi:hypothetical protein